MFRRHGWLALLGVVAGVGGAHAAPAVPSVSAAPAAVVRLATPAPTLDLTRFFDRLTVPLGTVPVVD